MTNRQIRADAHDCNSLGRPPEAGEAGAGDENQDHVPRYFTLYLLREILNSIGFKPK